MILTYLSYVLVFFLGFGVCAALSHDARTHRDTTEKAFRNLRTGRMTRDDERELRDAAAFDRDSMEVSARSERQDHA